MAAKMTPPSLPDEIVYQILSHLDSIQVANAEKVCKQWKEVARNNKTLWRNGLFIDLQSNQKDVAVNGSERFNSLLQRGGGMIDSLYLDPKSYEDDDVGHIAELLPKSNVKDLWINLTEHHTNSKYRIFSVLFLTLVVECLNLKSLHISTAFSKGLKNMFDQYLQKESNSKFKLERLTLSVEEEIDFSKFGPALIQMCSGVRVLRLFFENQSWMDRRYDFLTDPDFNNAPVDLPDRKDLFDVLRSIKDSLEEFVIPLDVIKVESEKEDIIFSKLSKLHIISHHGQVNAFNELPELPDRLSFKCPVLRDLTLDGTISTQICENLFNEDLEAFRIVISNPKAYFSDEPFAKPLQNCLKLKCLTLNFVPLSEEYEKTTQTIEEYIKKVNLMLFSLPIENLILYGIPREVGMEVAHFVEKRIDDIKATKIKALQIYSTESMNYEIFSYLKSNVEFFEFHNQRSRINVDFPLERDYTLKRNNSSQSVELLECNSYYRSSSPEL